MSAVSPPSTGMVRICATTTTPTKHSPMQSPLQQPVGQQPAPPPPGTVQTAGAGAQPSAVGADAGTTVAPSGGPVADAQQAQAIQQVLPQLVQVTTQLTQVVTQLATIIAQQQAQQIASAGAGVAGPASGVGGAVGPGQPDPGSTVEGGGGGAAPATGCCGATDAAAGGHACSHMPGTAGGGGAAGCCGKDGAAAGAGADAGNPAGAHVAPDLTVQSSSSDDDDEDDSDVDGGGGVHTDHARDSSRSGLSKRALQYLERAHEFGLRLISGRRNTEIRPGKKSDHAHGNAIDVSNGSRPSDEMQAYADAMRRQPGVKYVIYDNRIASPTDDWAWRPYTPPGANNATTRHEDHVHVSVS